MQTILVGNEKGGVGKTTTATSLSGELASRGYVVLLIDADPQGHATKALGIPKSGKFYDWAVRDAVWMDADHPDRSSLSRIEPTRYLPDGEDKGKGEMFLLASNVETRNVANSISSVWKVKNRLKEVEAVFDYVVIDTSPTPSLLHSAFYVAADYIVLPTLLEDWSLDGVAETLGHLEQVNEERLARGMAELAVAGIIPMMFKSGRIVADTFGEELRGSYEKVLSGIPDRETFRKAAALNTLVTVFEPNSDAAKAVRLMVDEVLGNVA